VEEGGVWRKVVCGGRWCVEGWWGGGVGIAPMAFKLLLTMSKRFFKKGLLLHTIKIWSFCLDLGGM